MDRRIVFVKRCFKGICPDSVEFAELFTNKSIKRRVRPFLRTLDDRVDELNLDRTISFLVYETKNQKDYGLLDPPAAQF